MKSLKEFGVFDVTPIEEHRGILYKRDDQFMPFPDAPLSGGKVRQAITLIHNNYEYIKNDCNSWIVTGTSVNSPQGIIVSKIAQEFGFKSILVFGATNKESLQRNPMVMNAVKMGAKVDFESKLAYETTLMSRIRYMSETMKFYIVKFGINLDTDPQAIIDSTAYQVQNIPDELDVLVVPVGSAISFGGILKGIVKYKKNIKRIIGVQISGYDRSDVVDRILCEDYINYEFIPDKTYPYSKHLKTYFNDKELLDPVYEAKAFDYMMKNIDVKNNKTLFWIVGNSAMARKPW